MFKHYETATGNWIKMIQTGKEVLFKISFNVSVLATLNFTKRMKRLPNNIHLKKCCLKTVQHGLLHKKI
jgi:multidrug resistance efflux pump